MPLRHHLLRHELAEELHSRPQPELAAPCSVSFVLLLAGEAMADRVREAIRALCARYGAPPPHHDRYHAVMLGGFGLRWEQHTEFYTLTFTREVEPGTAPFAATAYDLVPKDWLGGIPGEMLTAAHVAVIPAPAPLEGDALGVWFEGHRVAASRVMTSRTLSGAGTVWSSMRPHGDGFVRYVVEARGLTPARAGRLVQRLLEIEAYRMMALLGLPVARANSLRLRGMEERLAVLVRELAEVRDHAGEQARLDELFALAAEAERMVAETAYRFGATAAYGQLVADRFKELRAERMDEFQPLHEFLERRFEPALRTCRSIADRQVALGARVARTADLARTRVFVELERQNQALLSSMDQRARLQLRLQETVEGLSVAAISYYLVGLLSYLLKGAKEVGLGAGGADLVTAVATPLVVAVIWLGMRRMRRRLRDGAPSH